MWIVDRIEGEFAVCEGPGRESRALPLASLPAGLREGDCLRLRDGSWAVDPEETARRRQANAALLRALRKEAD